MKVPLLILGMLLTSQAAGQEPGETPSDGSDLRADCLAREVEPTVTATLLRDSGFSKQSLLDKISSGQAESPDAQVQVDLIEDVFGNPDLDASTLSMFRAHKCVHKISLGTSPVYKAEMRQALVACMRESAYNAVKIRECIAEAAAANIVKQGLTTRSSGQINRFAIDAAA